MSNLVFNLDLLIILYVFIGLLLSYLVYYIYNTLNKELPIGENAQKFINNLDYIKGFEIQFDRDINYKAHNIFCIKTNNDLYFEHNTLKNNLIIINTKFSIHLVNEYDYKNENLIKLNRNEKLLIISKIINYYKNIESKKDIENKKSIKNIMDNL